MSDRVDDDGTESPVTGGDFSVVSRAFCSDYALNGDRAAPAEPQLFSGRLTLRSLSSGIHLSTAGLLALQDSAHQVVLPRSACLVLTVAGVTSDVLVGRAERHTMRAGETGLYFFADDMASEGRYTAGQHSSSILIQLREDLLQDPQMQEMLHRELRGNSNQNLGFQARIAELSRSLFRREHQIATGVAPVCSTFSSLMAESQVLEILARALDARNDGGPGCRRAQEDRRKMQIVRDRLMAHPEQEHSLSDLAREAGVGVSTLKVKFRQSFGKSVFEFLRQARLDLAREGLSHKGWTVKEAAFFAGYRHPANFSTAFQKHFGFSPTDY